MLIIEYECARLIQQSTGTPAVAGNYVLVSLYTLGLIISLINKKIGFIIGIGAGIINAIVKVVIVISGHENFPYYPIVWITQSLMVIYFCYRALKVETTQNHAK
jgi:hypothetical protein